MMIYRAYIRLFCQLLLAVLLSCFASCGGRNGIDHLEGGHPSPPNANDAGTVARPQGDERASAPGGLNDPYPELHAALQAEFDRLGIDPDRVAAKAPAGSGNSVFDFATGISDPDGEGPELPDGIELSWTERSIGDYDGNGIVNISDLTPLGQKLETQVQYRESAAVDFFPLGNPVTDSANWLNARVDGDGNALISQADITPIAQHWNERLSGYRLYRRGPDGAGGFELLPDPESPSSGYSIQRSAQPGQPVRYSYVDEPPLPGEYEYYVAAYDAPGSEESPEQSNLATINVEFGFADDMPPDWDTTTGVQSAVANPDGTVTLSWGSASEMAPLGVQTSEPVNYVVYYSTESPIDYERAARIDNIVEQTWTSIPLVDGVEYYFSVRCRDSHEPPNEDDNTVELAATVIGGVVDDEWPVWVETFPHWVETFPHLTEKKIEGIRQVDVFDGKLQVYPARAMDLLSPPVHYDLYYIDARLPDEDLYQSQLGWDAPNPLAELIPDVKDGVEVLWPNRTPVTLGIRARDSATEPNEDLNVFTYATSPGIVKYIPIDPYFPGLSEDEELETVSCILSDPQHKQYYIAYSIGEVLRIVVLDAQTGEWQLEQVLHSPQAGEDVFDTKMAYDWQRNPILFMQAGANRFYKRSAGGVWTEWLPGRELRWDSQYLRDQNGNPADYSLEISDVQANRRKLYFEWYDEEAGDWVSEFVTDPGGQPQTILRPDGVLQLIVRFDSKGPGDDTPTKGRLLERSPEGVWTEVMSGDGSIGLEDFPYPTWESEWGWTAFTSIRGESELLAATITGYELLPSQELNGQFVASIKQVDSNGTYDALPRYIYEDGKHRYQSLHSSGYYSDTAYSPGFSPSLNLLISAGGSFGSHLLNPQDGFYSVIDMPQQKDKPSRELVIVTFPDGENLYNNSASQ